MFANLANYGAQRHGAAKVWLMSSWGIVLPNIQSWAKNNNPSTGNADYADDVVCFALKVVVLCFFSQL